MSDKCLLPIGKAAEISGVSPKTLRYYESLDLIRPRHVSEENGYRYYDKEVLLRIPVIKYYQQVGLDLKRIKELLTHSGCSNHYHHLKQRRDEITAEQKELLISLASVDDWMQLIVEGEMCLQNHALLEEKGYDPIVNVKYYHEHPGYCYEKQAYNYRFKESIINLEWIKHLEERQLGVSGPVIFQFDDYKHKMNGETTEATILQYCLPESPDSSTFGGFMALSCYHIGPLENIKDTYEYMTTYAINHSYEMKSESYERYVIDYWITHNPEEFVTEIIIPIVNKEDVIYRH